MSVTGPVSVTAPLVDRYGRVHTDLRISVTDRCNIRCRYCMPAEGVRFRPREEILSFEEIEGFVRVAARLGVRHLRLTGGEPLVRKHVSRLVAKLAAVPAISDLAMTTNGILLEQYAAELKAAGLMRLNISLDTLDAEKFRQLTRRDELPRVLAGIAAARRAGFRRTKLNALAIRNFSEEQIVPLARFARENRMQLRFIELMPVQCDPQWGRDRVLPARLILEALRKGIGPLEPVGTQEAGSPATEYRVLADGSRIGLIRSVTEPFCRRCNRLRLTADGKLRNCLFSDQGWDARAILRGGGPPEHLVRLIRQAVRAKRFARGTEDGRFAPCDRPMHQIGG